MNRFLIDDSDLKGILENPIVSSNNHYVSDCPYCFKQKHFYINRKTQLFDCKKCGVEGNIFSLLKHLDKLFLFGDFKTIDRKKIKLLSEEEDAEEKTFQIKNIKLPIGFKRVYKDSYLENRKLTRKNLEKYKVGYTNIVPSLKDYVIFSVEEDGICKGYISRYTKKIKDKKVLRYRNSKNTNFSKLLFGYDDIEQGSTSTVIIVEGLIDKITLDNFLDLDNQKEIKSVCTFGKKISDVQVLKLLIKDIKKIILLFDKDAIKEMKKYGNILSESFDVLIGFTEKKDINDSEKKDIVKIFENLKTPFEFSTKIVKIL